MSIARRARSARAAPGPFAPRSPGGRLPTPAEIAAIHRRYFGAHPLKERLLFGNAGFLCAFGTARVITHAIRAGKGPFSNIDVGGRHIHHMTFGIVTLLLTGLLWLAGIGTPAGRGGRPAMLTIAFAYGAGAGLTLDEFALWLNLRDDYWTEEGRMSIDAVALFGCLLMLSLLGARPSRELIALSRRRRARARRRRRGGRLSRR